MWQGSGLFNIDFSNNKIIAPDISGIMLNKSGCCEMLNKNNMCSLWIKFGREAIPEGCRNFTEKDCEELCGRLKR